MDKVYSPINQLKPVGENIWIVDGEAIDFYGLPFTTRMTIIRLKNGDLFCHSPIGLTKDLAQQVKQLGNVRHLVSPNWIHYAYIPEWVKEFENTIAWASPNVRARAKKFKVDIKFDDDLAESADRAWAEEIEQIIVRGSKGHIEVVFFHKPSKTLILTDLIENFEPQKISWAFRLLAKFAGNLDPDGKAPIDMRLSFLFGKKKLKQAVEQMLTWQPEKVILSHGRWYETDAIGQLKRSFRWVL